MLLKIIVELYITMRIILCKWMDGNQRNIQKAYVGTCMKTGVLCNLIAIALLVYVLAVCISIHNIIHYI